MIETASACRLAGDWRGACRAAGFDLRINPDVGVHRRYGGEVGRQLLDDLRHFAPDLLRWQLPRQLRDGGRLQAGLVIPLAEYAGGGQGAGDTLMLAAITPPRVVRPLERVVLAGLPLTAAGAGWHSAAASCYRAWFARYRPWRW